MELDTPIAEDESAPWPASPGPAPFRCEDCGQPFFSEKRFDQHRYEEETSRLLNQVWSCHLRWGRLRQYDDVGGAKTAAREAQVALLRAAQRGAKVDSWHATLVLEMLGEEGAPY